MLVALLSSLTLGLMAPPARASSPNFDGQGKKSAPAKPAQKPAQKPAEKPAQKPAEKPMPKAAAIGSEVDAGITMTDTAGKAHVLKDLRGKIVVVHFWSSGFNAYDARLAALAKEYEAKGITFLGVDSDPADAADPKKLGEAITKAGLAFPVSIDKDGMLAEKFGAQTTSQSFVIDAKGMLRYSGAIDDDPKSEKADKATPHVKRALEALLAGKDVPAATTPPAGNPIKREKAPVPAGAGKEPKAGGK